MIDIFYKNDECIKQAINAAFGGKLQILSRQKVDLADFINDAGLVNRLVVDFKDCI